MGDEICPQLESPRTISISMYSFSVKVELSPSKKRERLVVDLFLPCKKALYE